VLDLAAVEGVVADLIGVEKAREGHYCLVYVESEKEHFGYQVEVLAPTPVEKTAL
jgi:hypothetical protein